MAQIESISVEFTVYIATIGCLYFLLSETEKKKQSLHDYYDGDGNGVCLAVFASSVGFPLSDFTDGVVYSNIYHAIAIATYAICDLLWRGYFGTDIFRWRRLLYPEKSFQPGKSGNQKNKRQKVSKLLFYA